MAITRKLPESAKQRLRDEPDAWLTSIRADGQPQSSVIWFWWDDGGVWIRSQPETGKLTNIRHQPRVSVNLNTDGRGGAVVTLEGTAELVADLPGAVREQYLMKYGRQIRTSLRTTPQEFLADYSTTIRVEVDRVRAW